MRLFPSHFALALTSLLFQHSAHAALEAASAPIVGEATLIIGQALLLSADGASRAIERGTTVRVGDQVQTQAGGHVYLRFVDGANLSVRPMSRMHIESYSHNPQQPQLGAIKFKLEEGTARSITGAWGEAARERFRLNTPVAAIGVKGTDFTVRSNAQGTCATVYTGSIVLAPLTSGCAAGVGPCHTGLETQLSADMRGQMLQLATNDPTPLLVAATNLTRQGLPRAAPPADRMQAIAFAGDMADIRAEPPGTSKSLSNEIHGITVATLEVPPPAPVPAPPPPAPVPAPPPAAVETPTTPPPVAQPELPAQPPTPIGPPAVTQLSWARYPWTTSFSADQFIQAFADAAKAGHETASAGNGAYILYRDPTGSTASHPTQAVVDLRLANASAHLQPNYNWMPAEAVTVQSGSLQIDFSRSLFQTALALQGASVGNQSVSATGTISASGAILGTGGNAAVSGAVTPDGTEAGYFFQKILPQGALRGVTLWGR